ncbi:hypothetical protein L493_4491 [Bordetella bronchiseptica 99-R-0433]|nr:hypothetical protein L493_4491 [Bordetella bronchiseptica 99-R-0433]
MLRCKSVRKWCAVAHFWCAIVGQNSSDEKSKSGAKPVLARLAGRSDYWGRINASGDSPAGHDRRIFSEKRMKWGSTAMSPFIWRAFPWGAITICGVAPCSWQAPPGSAKKFSPLCVPVIF